MQYVIGLRTETTRRTNTQQGKRVMSGKRLGYNEDNQRNMARIPSLMRWTELYTQEVTLNKISFLLNLFIIFSMTGVSRL